MEMHHVVLPGVRKVGIPALFCWDDNDIRKRLSQIEIPPTVQMVFSFNVSQIHLHWLPAMMMRVVCLPDVTASKYHAAENMSYTAGKRIGPKPLPVLLSLKHCR